MRLMRAYFGNDTYFKHLKTLQLQDALQSETGLLTPGNCTHFAMAMRIAKHL